MSVIPAAIDALLVVFRAIPGVMSDEVFDGNEPRTPPRRYLVVGFDAEDDFPGDGSSSMAGLVAPRRQDTATLACLAFAATGSSDLRRARQDADELFTAARGAIEADPRLGGAVTFAQVVSYTYRPVRDPNGSGALFEFRVQVTVI